MIEYLTTAPEIYFKLGCKEAALAPRCIRSSTKCKENANLQNLPSTRAGPVQQARIVLFTLTAFYVILITIFDGQSFQVEAEKQCEDITNTLYWAAVALEVVHFTGCQGETEVRF